MTSTNQETLASYLTDLRLSTIKASYEETAQRAANDSLSYEQYLYELVLAEHADQHHRRIQRRLKLSKLPLEKTWESFQLKRLPLKIKQHFLELRKGDFIARHDNVLVFGSPGTGKTHGVCALAQEFVRQGHKVYFSPCSLLVQDLLAAKKTLELAKCLKRLAAYDVIVIDDIGYVQQTRDEMDVLFTLLADRYESGSLMITSNLPFSKWDTIFKDPMTAAAAIDRLIHHSTIIELNLSSYRLDHAKQSHDSLA